MTYGNEGLKCKVYIKKWWKNSYERRDYEAVAGKQQLNTARTNLSPTIIQEGIG